MAKLYKTTDGRVSRFKSLTGAMTGTQPVFSAQQDSPQQQPQQPQFSLPQNYGLNDLAGYEEQRRQALGQLNQQDILGLADQYSSDAAKRRSALSTSLLDQGQQTFNLQNPKILEDLNSRGLATSPSAVNQSQTDALKEIALANGQQLNQFDNQTFNELNSLKGAGLSARMQGGQDALDAGLDLRRSELERQFQGSQADKEQAYAEQLAKQQQKNQLTNSLIGVGGQLGTTFLGAKMLGGGGSSLFSGVGGGAGAGVGGASYAGAGAPASSLFPGGLGSVGTGSTGAAGAGFTPGIGSVGAAGIGAAILSRAAEKKVGAKAGTTAGGIGGIVANPIGAQINFAKKLVTDPKKTISNAANSVAKPVSSAAKSVAKSVSSAFCFEAGTPIEMDDGSRRPISQLYVGAKTKGGEVISIRTSISAEGTRFVYKGVEVTGSHAVNENGTWIRVQDSDYSAKQDGPGTVWSLVTDKHRIWIDGIEFADEHENDDYEHLTIEQSLDELNKQQKSKEGVLL